MALRRIYGALDTEGLKLAEQNWYNIPKEAIMSQTAPLQHVISQWSTINSKKKGTPKGVLFAHIEATFDFIDFGRSEFTCTYIIAYGYILCASKFATVKIECSWQMGK